MTATKSLTNTSAPALMSEDELTLAMGRLDGVMWLLIRCYGGEVKEDERAGEYEIVLTLRYVHRLIGRMHLAFNDKFGDDFGAALSDAYGLASAIHAMTWAEGSIAGSDTVMVELFDALDSCITEMTLAHEACRLRTEAAAQAAPAGDRTRTQRTAQTHTQTLEHA